MSTVLSPQKPEVQANNNPVPRDLDPPLLKLVRWGFPKLEKVSPGLANKLFQQLFFTPFRVSEPEKETAVLNQSQQIFLDVAGKKVAAYVWGEGESDKTVLLCHGWIGRAGMFREFINPLQKAGYRVVSFDGPAHGRSTGRQSNILEFQDTVLQLNNLYGPFEAIIGHSFGGVVGLFSIKHGLKCDKLVMIGSPTQANKILKQYLKRINGAWDRAEAFKKSILKRGYNFEQNDAVHLVQQLKKPLDLFIVHDVYDKEVMIGEARALKEVYPAAKTLETEKLGHNRILRNESVIDQVIDFIGVPTH